MPVYPLATLAATVDASGISAPSYADILASIQASYRSIYGSDAYLDADSQDGEFIAIFVLAISQSNATAIAVWDQFSPATAQGEGLSSVVKTNGITRRAATSSTVDVTLIGQAGTVITNGRVGDTLNQSWVLPTPVTIPITGAITVTATASAVGDQQAAPGSVTSILTPTRGWQSVTNASAASVGVAVETDAELRQRQAISAALPSNSPLVGIRAAVASLAGVSDVQAFENDTDVTDANGLPPHSYALIVQGGDAVEIATVIANKKVTGSHTVGTTSEVIADQDGMLLTIRFYRPTFVRIIGQIDLVRLGGYQSPTSDAVAAAVAAYITALKIGDPIYLNRLYTPANLADVDAGATFEIPPDGIRIARFGNTPTAANLALAFNEAATADPADFVVNVT